MIQSRIFFLLGHFIFYLCGFSVLSPCAMCRKLARPPSRCGQEKSLYVVLSVHVKIVFAIAIYFAQLSVLRNNSRLVKCIEFLQPEKFRLSRNLAAERHGNEITIFETCSFFDDENKRSSGEYFFVRAFYFLSLWFLRSLPLCKVQKTCAPPVKVRKRKIFLVGLAFTPMFFRNRNLFCADFSVSENCRLVKGIAEIDDTSFEFF